MHPEAVFPVASAPFCLYKDPWSGMRETRSDSDRERDRTTRDSEADTLRDSARLAVSLYTLV